MAPVQYLSSGDLATFGVPNATTAQIVAASLLIKAHCKRDLAPVFYQSLHRLPKDRNDLLIPYKPILSLAYVQGRYGYTRRGQAAVQQYAATSMADLFTQFGGPPPWFDVDVTQVAVDAVGGTGQVWIPVGIYIAHYSDARLGYWSGYGYAPPTQAPVLSAGVGGSLAAGTYYVTTTYTIGGGETPAGGVIVLDNPNGTSNTETVYSSEASITVAANGSITVTPGTTPVNGAPWPPGGSMNVYIGTTQGATNVTGLKAGSITGPTGSLVITAMPASNAGNPPSSNTAILIPDDVKQACAMLIQAVMNRPDASVQHESIGGPVGISHQFTPSLIGHDVANLLGPYVARRYA